MHPPIFAYGCNTKNNKQCFSVKVPAYKNDNNSVNNIPVTIQGRKRKTINLKYGLYIAIDVSELFTMCFSLSSFLGYNKGLHCVCVCVGGLCLKEK